MWTTRRFRSSPALELKRLDDLTPEQREAFLELQDDAEFYGLLVPRVPSAMSIKSVGEQTAALFRELATPSTLDLSLDLSNDEIRNDVIDLLLDGVLEIEADDAFVTGPAAFPIVHGTPAAELEPAGIGRLSIDALLHAQDLAVWDTGSLTAALYTYNRIPLTRFWQARFADRDAVLTQLGADSGPLKSLLDRFWNLTPSELASGWISWSSRTPMQRYGGKDAPTFKLYVSPRPEHLRDAFHALVRVLAEQHGPQFKIGQDAAGLLRPDKFVAYFGTKEDLDRALASLHAELAGCPAHGVPFTAGVGDDGLLSWGIDPPDSDRALSWQQRESWRLWVATRLASALAIAKSSPAAGVEPWRFAIERVRRHGVDVDTWTPAATIWRTAA